MWSVHLAMCALFAARLGAAKFIVPSSADGDFYESYNIGDTITIQWEAGWNWGRPEELQPEYADLFIMWFDTPKAYSKLLQENVSLATKGNFTWTFDVPDDKIIAQPKFLFRFSNHTDPPVFNFTNPKMPSRGFMLHRKAISPPNPSEPNEAPKKKSNNTAAIAGAVLGGLLGLSAILGTILVILRRQRKKKEACEGEEKLNERQRKMPHEAHAHYMQELPMPPSELPGQKPGRTPELHGSMPREWH